MSEDAQALVERVRVGLRTEDQYMYPELYRDADEALTALASRCEELEEMHGKWVPLDRAERAEAEVLRLREAEEAARVQDMHGNEGDADAIRRSALAALSEEPR